MGSLQTIFTGCAPLTMELIGYAGLTIHVPAIVGAIQL